MYRFFADLILLVHVSFVAFVVLMVPLIFIGGVIKWNWVRSLVIRWFHLIGIGIVVLQSWLGIICPLTTLEMWLRGQSGDITYTGSFIEHWMQRLLYWDFPWWVFVVLYTIFGAIVIATWFVVPPERRSKERFNQY